MSTFAINDFKIGYLDSIVLSQIALLKGYEGGDATYIARAMLRIFPEDISENRMMMSNTNDNDGNPGATENNNFIVVYPNPAKNELFINFQTKDYINAYIEIFNNMGIIIKQIKISGSLTNISTSGLTSGVYFYKLYNNNTLIKTDKFTIIN